MRVATVDGLVTLFYDGSRELCNARLEWMSSQGNGTTTDECKEYIRERMSWQQIIIVDGVTEIPEWTFYGCKNIKRVIFANSVIRVEERAFKLCKRLVFIKWSNSLEYIGPSAFEDCNLSSVFVPPRCREICNYAFAGNKNLSILNIPQNTELGINIFLGTALAEASPFEGNFLLRTASTYMNTWLKNMNNDEAFALHRACSAFQPLKEVIHIIIQEKGLKAFREENSAGITSSQYLKENPNNTLTEKEIIREYLMKMMGEFE